MNRFTTCFSFDYKGYNIDIISRINNSGRKEYNASINQVDHSDNIFLSQDAFRSEKAAMSFIDSFFKKS